MKTYKLKISDALHVDSSAGNLLKWTINENNKTIFIKTSTYNSYNNIWLYESYSEIINCRLFKELGIKNTLMYYPCKIMLDNGEITLGCYSYSFLKEDETYISLAHLHKIGKLQNYMFTGIDGYKQCISDVKTVLNIDYTNELNKIIILDYLVLNEDRHTGNFGFIYNYRTNKFKIAPIFDNGNSLFSLKNIEGMSYTQKLDNYVKSKPFYYKHEMQLNMLNTKIKLNHNIEGTLQYIEELNKLGLDTQRIEFIKTLLITRLHMLLERNKL